jgi:ATP-dependent DNA helicase DinG
MAEQVAAAIEGAGTLVCEAGTGIGKTFAYLVPALLSGRRIIVSTGTRNLQDQLFRCDLPRVRQALKLSVEVAMLKGRANYLCLYRLQEALGEGGGKRRRQAEIEAVRVWSGRTRSGDIAELSEVPEDSPIWPQVTSTSDNCLGGECPCLADCHVAQARRAAQAAEVVIVNHHLFLADLALKDQGFGDILPGADAVIFDEAHQLPETATQFFGSQLSSRQCFDLVRDCEHAQVQEAADTPHLRDLAQRLDKAMRDLRLALGPERRAVWDDAAARSETHAAMGRLRNAFTELRQALEPAAARGPALANALRRCLALNESLRLFCDDPGDGGSVRWYETHARGLLLSRTPLDVAPMFRARLQAARCAWIFTSATLAVRGDCSYFTGQLGIDAAVTGHYESPFDYARQALLYLPILDVDPRVAGYTGAVVDAVLPVLEASGGRAFLLFTSHRALREAEAQLRDRIGFPLLVQGEAPKADLLARFRALGNAVLLGSASFWEGVDVRGDALSVVVIDKLPFAVPDDPVVQARIRALHAADRNAFTEYQLPEAAIALKQGAGRLIRDVGDRGVLVLCDPRLRTKSYGRKLRAALPPMPATERLADVRAFFTP